MANKRKDSVNLKRSNIKEQINSTEVAEEVLVIFCDNISQFHYIFYRIPYLIMLMVMVIAPTLTEK